MINTLREILKSPHWYSASKVQETLRLRKKQILKQRERSLNRSYAESSFYDEGDETNFLGSGTIDLSILNSKDNQQGKDLNLAP